MTSPLRKLLTTDQVADVVGVTARKVRDLPIPFARIGKLRRYDPRDVEGYIKDSMECQSSHEKVRRISTRNSKSTAIGFAEALKQQPVGMRKESKSA